MRFLFFEKEISVTPPAASCEAAIIARPFDNPMSSTTGGDCSAFVAPLPVARGPCLRSATSPRPPLPRRHVRRSRLAAAPAVSCSTVDELWRADVPEDAASGVASEDAPLEPAPPAIEDVPLEPVPPIGELLPERWGRPGVYGIYAEGGTLVYIGATWDVKRAIDVHRVVIDDPRRVFAAKVISEDGVDADWLDTVANDWLDAHTDQGLDAPEGNTDGAPEWQKFEMPQGRGGVEVNKEDVEREISRVIEEHTVVLFMKGRRDAPMCGFSAAVVDLLKHRIGSAFECVDCLDESRNPGLREGIKAYSDWPTIPQLYISGEFVGGADIIANMDYQGELAAEFEKAGVPVRAGNKQPW